MKKVKLFEQFISEAKMDIFPEYNNGLESSVYKKSFNGAISKTDINPIHTWDSTGWIHVKSNNNMEDVDLTVDIQKALKGFDNNLDLDNITSNIGKPNQISKNDADRGIVSYRIPKKVDWWTLKRARGNNPSTETKLTPEIVDSILDRMAQVSTTQDQLADQQWTSLSDLLKAAEEHMSSSNYKKFVKEIKAKYPKMK